MHQPDAASHRFAVGIPERAHHGGGPIRVRRNRFRTEQHIEQCFSDEAVRSRQAIDQRQWIRLRPPLATTDRSERRGDGDQAPQSGRLAGRQGDAHMPTPRIADPIHRRGDTEPIQHLAGGFPAVIEREVAMYGPAAAVSGTVDCHHASVRTECVYQRTPTARIDPQAVPQHGRRARAGLTNIELPEARGHRTGICDARVHGGPT